MGKDCVGGSIMGKDCVGVGRMYIQGSCWGRMGKNCVRGRGMGERTRKVRKE